MSHDRCSKIGDSTKNGNEVAKPPAFAADRTVGKLAKWLRMMGFDTVYQPYQAGREIQAFGDSNRIYLTRVRKLNSKISAERIILIDCNDIESQIKQVISRLNLKYEVLEPFTRCLVCNEKLAEIGRGAAWGSVPDYVWETHSVFRQCPGCRRIFWPGTHVQRSRERLMQFFDE